ncbi:DEK1, partial [Symbiodinium pilosum]
EAAQLPKEYPLQLGLAYLLLVGYLVRTLFVSCNLPASVGVILTGWIFSYFIQEDIFVGRDMLQELAFFLVLLTAGLEISILHLKPYFFVLALIPCTAELLTIAAYSVCNLEFTWAEGLNLGTVLVAVGDGLVIPKMKEFSLLHKQHPMTYLMLCWAPVEASYALTLFGVFTAVSAPATMPSLNVVLLLASTIVRIAATVVVGAALGYAAGFLIEKRKKATLFSHKVFTNEPVEAFLMLLAIALCAYGLGSSTKGRPTLPLFLGYGSLFQPELMVIVTGSVFAMFCEKHCPEILVEVETIMGGVWVFAQLILFAMLGSKTSPSIFPNLVKVLPIMAVGLLARFAGVLVSVKATAEHRGAQNQRWQQMIADACFCFLSVLPRATIQGALGAVPVNQRFFQDVAREDRSEARDFIFTAARLYIFCMSIVGMFLLNTFGPVLLKDMQAAH